MVDKKEQRRIYYDRDLEVKVYNPSGIVQEFPSHFYEYYVIEFVEGGRRHLYCKEQGYGMEMGDLLLFNPRDNYLYGPINGEILDYRAANAPMDVTNRAVLEIIGEEFTPHFTQNMVKQSEIAQPMDVLYDAILGSESKLKREETFFFLLEQVLREYATPFEDTAVTSPDGQIRMSYDCVEGHYAENISLDKLLSMTNLGKLYLLWVFTKQVGVSPYHYLQNVKLNRVKKLLEQDVAPMDATVTTGFSNQSHFSNSSEEFIGLTPKRYRWIFEEDTEADRRGSEEAVEDRMDGEAEHEQIDCGT